MTFLEILLMIVAITFSFLGCRNIGSKMRLVFLCSLTLLFILHLAIDGWRLQMAFLYCLLFYFIVEYIINPDGGRKLNKMLYFRVLVMVLVVFYLVLMISLPLLIKRYEMPKPLGKLNVGAMDIEFTDKSRLEMFTANPIDNRKLRVRIWYPTDENSGKLISYRENSFTRSEGVSMLLFSHLNEVKNYAQKNVSLSRTRDKYPVIVYSHGLNFGSKEMSTFFGESLASFGFIVFSIDHSYQSLPVEFTDKTIAYVQKFKDMGQDEKNKERKLIDLLTKYQKDKKKKGKIYEQIFRLNKQLMQGIKVWEDDFGSVVNKIKDLNSHNDFFKGRIDLTKLGAGGFSYGGAAAVNFCKNNTICKAVINHDGAQFGAVSQTGINKPFMIMYSEPNAGMNNEFYLKSSAEGYQVVVKGTSHLNYCDLSLLSPIIANLLYYNKIKSSIKPELAHHIINRNTVCFFQKYLLNDRSCDLFKLNKQFKNVEIEKNFQRKE